MPDTLVVLIVILILAVIWRGPRNLPKIGAMLGRGVKEVRTEADRLHSGEDDDSSPKTS